MYTEEEFAHEAITALFQGLVARGWDPMELNMFVLAMCHRSMEALEAEKHTSEVCNMCHGSGVIFEWGRAIGHKCPKCGKEKTLPEMFKENRHCPTK